MRRPTLTRRARAAVALATTAALATTLAVQTASATPAPAHPDFTVTVVPHSTGHGVDRPEAVHPHPDGARVFVGNAQPGSARTLTIIDRATRTVVGSVDTEVPVVDFAFDTAGDVVYVSGTDGKLRFIRLSDGAILRTLSITPPDGTGAYGRHLTFNPSNQHLYLYETYSATLVSLDTATPSSPVFTEMSNRSCTEASGMALDPTKNALVLACPEGNKLLTVPTAALGTTLKTTAVTGSPGSLTLDTDKQLAYVMDLRTGLLSVLNMATGTQTNKDLGCRFVGSTELDARNDLLYVICIRQSYRELEVLKASTLTEVTTLHQLYSSPYRLAMAGPDLFVTDTGSEDPGSVHVVTYTKPSTPTPTPTPTTPATTTRWGGADRYATNAAVVAAAFPNPVATVYIANGLNYPDALTGGPAAAHHDAPLLLVGRDTLPDVMAAQLRRLQPQRIVVLGGNASVSPALQSALGPFAQSVTRVAGADRYATAAAVALATWQGAKPDTVYLVSGRDYADALSAGSPAAQTDSAVLLTQPGTLPAATLDALRKMAPRRIVVVGGNASVSAAVQNALKPLASVVTRVAGPDRYATNTALTRVTWPDGAAHTLFASGTGFADALSATPAAARLQAPLLLAKPACSPAGTTSESARLGSTQHHLIGGPGSLSTTAPGTTCR